MSHMSSAQSVKNYVIVTEDPVYARQLFPKVEILEQDMQHGFIALMKAKKDVDSNSCLAYFPLRFNNKEPYVIAPKYWAWHNVSDGYWACRSNIYSGYMYMDWAGVITDDRASALEAYEFMDMDAGTYFTTTHSYPARYPNRIKSFLRNRLEKYE